MVVLGILLCIFNMVMWLLAIVRFRKIFSTDDIVKRTRDELDTMMMEINRNAERNVSLIEDRIKKLHEAMADADRHMEILRGELSNTEKSRAFQSKVSVSEPSRYGSNRISLAPEVDSAELRKETTVKKTRTYSRKSSSRPVQTPAPADDAEIMENQPAVEPEKTVQTGRPRGPLASYQHELKRSVKVPSEKAAPVEDDGDALSREMIDSIVRKSSLEIESLEEGENPASKADEGPQVIVAPKLIRPKKSKKEQVHDLYETGMTVEEIARQLKIATDEVEFIVEMFK